MSVEEILLEVSGDTESATRAIEDLAKDLAIFSKESVEAEATVNTEQAKNELRTLRAALERLDHETSNPKVNADIGQALVELEVIQQELDSVDGDTADLNVDVDRSIFYRLNAGLQQRLRDHQALPGRHRFDQSLDQQARQLPRRARADRRAPR